MSFSTIELVGSYQIFSPFSGKPAETEDGPNTYDTTLLFIIKPCTGAAYLSARMRSYGKEGATCLCIEDVLESWPEQAGVVIEVDTAGDGTNIYGFAPDEEPEWQPSYN